MQYPADQNRSIEEAAYTLYLQKGSVDGYDLSDWFEAEELSKRTITFSTR
jgi:hypothetical protein